MHTKTACLTTLLILTTIYTSPAAAQEKKEKRFVFAPMVTSSPGFGNGGGLMGLYFYNTDAKDRKSPPSSVTAIGMYSDTGSHFAGLFNQSFIREDHWRARGGLINAGINNELDINDLGRVEFSSDMYALMGRLERRITGNFFLGAQFSVNDTKYKEGNEASREYFELFAVEDSSSASFGFIASYDSRDNTRYPSDGILASLGVRFFPEALGAEDDYQVVEADVNSYSEVADNRILALRLYARITSSDTPYAGLSTLGQRSDLRGYTPGENIAENLLSAQAEYRWMLTRKWGAVAFGGIASLYDGDIGNVESDNTFASGGIGVRYALHEKNKMNFRVDFAWGEDDESGFYVSAREAF